MANFKRQYLDKAFNKMHHPNLEKYIKQKKDGLIFSVKPIYQKRKKEVN